MKLLPVLLLLLPLPAAAETWLCVGCPDFLSAAKPLIELRRDQGMDVHTASAPVPEAIRQCPQPPDYILILGDDEIMEGRAVEPWHVAADRRPYHGWKDSHPKEFVTDMAYGDRDKDGSPDAAVGRVPARTAEEVTAAVEKILRWEKHTPSLADLSIPIWAGDPGFTPFFRDMALGFLFNQIRGRAPAWAQLWVMQGDERSPFCGWPQQQPAAFNQRLHAGALVSAMIGHGHRTGWWSMDLPQGRLNYTVEHAAGLTEPQPAAPHFIFACECGSFAMRDRDGLAEALFRAPGGPVLCAGATEDSHPLTNYYHSTSVLTALAGPAARFGSLWLNSLRLAAAASEPDKEALVHNLLEPIFIGKKLRTEDIRADHTFLYNLIGDPATRLFSPAPLAAIFTVKGDGVLWKVAAPPPGARLFVQVRDPLPAYSLLAPSTSEKEAVARQKKANDALAFKTIREIPAGKAWKGIVKSPGTLRLAAVSASGISVAAFDLSRATPAPGSPSKSSPDRH